MYLSFNSVMCNYEHVYMRRTTSQYVAEVIYNLSYNMDTRNILHFIVDHSCVMVEIK